MPLAKFVPFRAADVNLAWLRNERFWPCPPVPTRPFEFVTKAYAEMMSAETLLMQLRKACICLELLREGDVLEPCPSHGWVTH